MFIKLNNHNFVNVSNADQITVESVNIGPKQYSDGTWSVLDDYNYKIVLVRDMWKRTEIKVYLRAYETFDEAAKVLNAIMDCYARGEKLVDIDEIAKTVGVKDVDN